MTREESFHVIDTYCIPTAYPHTEQWGILQKIKEAVKTLDENFKSIEAENEDLKKRLGQEPKILDKITDEIRQIVDEETEHDEKWARGLHYSLCIIDKYKAGMGTNEH